MSEDSTAQLTEDEAKLYDRQIRLWGVDSQKSIRNAKILIISMNGVGAEVAKNIILSGVKAVTFMDDAVASEEDSFSQFLIPCDKIGSNRAVASVERSKALNPLVTVRAISNSATSINEDDLQIYDVVIAVEQDTETITRLDTICRKNNIKFFSTDVFGMFGYYFSDLQHHEYIMEVPKLGKNRVNETTEKLTRVENFPSFKEAFDVDFTTEENKPLLHRMEPSYLLFRILMKFRRELKRYPTDSEEDFKFLSKLRDEELDGLSYSTNRLSDDLLRSCLGFPVSPVCAIIGAMVAQEVIKAVSHKDHPNKNMFFFNPLTNVGHVQFLSA
ncbi:SUMO1 activating enzyme subunit 1 [Rhodnius prolixus]